MFADPQLAARGLRIDMPHPLAGEVAQVGLPFALSATPPDYARAPPLLAQHTREVLRGRLARSDIDIDDLAARGVIQVRD
ncbi:MAG TPA: CoA transferase [Casimicrobiaceae bacterium]